MLKVFKDSGCYLLGDPEALDVVQISEEDYQDLRYASQEVLQGILDDCKSAYPNNLVQ